MLLPSLLLCFVMLDSLIQGSPQNQKDLLVSPTDFRKLFNNGQNKRNTKAMPTKRPFYSKIPEETASSSKALEPTTVAATGEPTKNHGLTTGKTAKDHGLATTTTPKIKVTEDVELIEDEMKLNTEWNDMLSLPDSQERKQFEAEFVQLMTGTLRTIAGFVEILVTGVRPGSIVVSYTVKVSSGSSSQYKNTMQGVYRSGSFGKYGVSKTQKSAFAKDEEEEDEDGPPKFVIVVILAALLLLVFGAGLFVLNKRRQRTIRARSFHKNTRKKKMTNFSSVGRSEKT